MSIRQQHRHRIADVLGSKRLTPLCPSMPPNFWLIPYTYHGLYQRTHATRQRSQTDSRDTDRMTFVTGSIIPFTGDITPDSPSHRSSTQNHADIHKHTNENVIILHPLSSCLINCDGKFRKFENNCSPF